MKTIPVLSSDEIQEDRPMPSRNHSRAAHNLSALLHPYRDRFTIHQQLSLKLDGWQTIPDICLYPKGVLKSDWDTDEDEVEIPPLLVIEILSPKQNLQPLVDKIREYLRQGVKSCWLVEPATEVVTVFDTKGKRAHTATLLRDEVVGIEISLPELFS